MSCSVTARCGEQKAEKAAAPVDDLYKNANPGDTATTKGILDDSVVQSFEDAGFAEDHRLSNLKLLLGALACAFALVAQFWYPLRLSVELPIARPGHMALTLDPSAGQTRLRRFRSLKGDLTPN